MRPDPIEARPLASDVPARSRPLARDLLELAKPRLTALVVVTTAVGYWLAYPPARSFELAPWFLTMLGTALVAAAASALNQWSERDHDRAMDRTAERPLPSGRLGSAAVAIYSLATGFGGLSLLCVEANHLAAGIALATLVLYVLVYTPLKRRHSLNTIAGAVPGALPPLIGWAAASGGLEPAAWTLFLVLFLWQVPHFLAIATLHRDDYARAGFRMLPVTDPGPRSGRLAFFYAALLVPAGTLPVLFGLGGPIYAAAAIGLGLWFAARAARFERAPSEGSARALFRASLVYLPALLVLLCLDPTAPLIPVPR